MPSGTSWTPAETSTEGDSVKEFTKQRGKAAATAAGRAERKQDETSKQQQQQQQRGRTTGQAKASRTQEPHPDETRTLTHGPKPNLVYMCGVYTSK